MSWHDEFTLACNASMPVVVAEKMSRNAAMQDEEEAMTSVILVSTTKKSF